MNSELIGVKLQFYRNDLWTNIHLLMLIVNSSSTCCRQHRHHRIRELFYAAQIEPGWPSNWISLAKRLCEVNGGGIVNNVRMCKCVKLSVGLQHQSSVIKQRDAGVIATSYIFNVAITMMNTRILIVRNFADIKSLALVIILCWLL